MDERQEWIVAETPVPRQDWKWYGYPGHFCGASNCRFHLCTEIGPWLVSTVGHWMPHDADKPMDIGYGRQYETMVFRWEGRCIEPTCGYWQPLIDPLNIDFLPANTPGEAQANHETLCQRWAERAVSPCPNEHTG